MADRHLKKANEVSGTEVFRLPAEMIKPEHLADAVQEWLKRPWRSWMDFPGGVPKAEVDNLIAALQKTEDMSVGELFGLVLSYTLTRATLRDQREAQGTSGNIENSLDMSSLMP